MNICLLNDSFPPVIDGVANTVMNYGRVLTGALGANVIVGTPRYPDTDYSGYPYKVVAYPSLDTTRLTSGYRTGYLLSVREIAEMSQFGPDIVHTHCPAASTLMARILQYETGAPVVFTYHTKFDVDIAKAVGDGFLKKETLKMLVNNISACDEVWVVSEGAGENLKSLGYEGDYRVMVNGVDFARGKASPEKVMEVTKGYDLPGDVPVFLFVGRLMAYKGIPIILDAMRRLKDSGTDFRMVFVGSGDYEPEMREKVKEYGIESRVIFTGPIRDREELRAIYTRCDLFLFPSTYDTNGIVVREAAACGLASVLIRDSCAAEGITHGRNGYMIEENGESMAALLSVVCRDMDALHKVGDNAMNEIYISWEDSVKNAYRRYEEIREEAKDGSLGKKRRQKSDLLIETAGEVTEKFKMLMDLPGKIKEDIFGEDEWIIRRRGEK
ncbi:MAG: glycosyltransferase [Lachnospiraceae bacterium]|nr:glycosyltransferase [Lachnospiraceae bacterium]